MRRRQDGIEREQREAGRRRLDVERVERGAGDFAGFDGFAQGVVVDQLAARN